MTFTVTGLSRCIGNNHVHVTLQIGQQAHELTILRSDLDLDNHEEIREAVVSRLRSAVKEAGASTPAQIQNTLLNQTFQV